MKKIKSVKKNGIPCIFSFATDLWEVQKNNDKGCREFVNEDVIMTCPLFEIEYEEDEIADLEKFYNTIQDICKMYENKKPDHN